MTDENVPLITLQRYANDSSLSLKEQEIDRLQASFKRDPKNALVQSAAMSVDIDYLARQHERSKSVHHVFSKVLDHWTCTNQKASGRCWMFAGLNLLRSNAMKKIDVANFELSQNYMFFYDKLERSNLFLCHVIQTSHMSIDSRLVSFLMQNVIGDGGQWDMFAALVKKYGVVPKDVMPETHSSSASRKMNLMIRERLREAARDIRDARREEKGDIHLKEIKDKAMDSVYRMLCIHLGTPPTHFTWHFKGKKDKSLTYNHHITPLQFYHKYITINVDDYVCLVNDPRPSHPFNKVYTVAYLHSVQGAGMIKYLNVDIELMKEVAMKSLLDGESVWIGLQWGRYMDRGLGMLDTKLFNYRRVYNNLSHKELSKADRLLYGHSSMTHAVMFTGVDVLDGRPIKVPKPTTQQWRVENSHGPTSGKKGFYVMSDEWFNDYMFEVCVRKSLLPEKLQHECDFGSVHVLPIWDPMGALARGETCDRQPDSDKGLSARL